MGLSANPNRLERHPRETERKPGFTGGTAPRRCTQRLSGVLFPPLCPDRVFRAGRCAEHYLEWRNARDARRRASAPKPRRSSGVRPAKPYMRKGGTTVFDRARLEKAEAKRARKRALGTGSR